MSAICVHQAEQVGAAPSTSGPGRPAAAAAPLGGVIVRKDFSHSLMHPADLSAYTKLGVGAVRCGVRRLQSYNAKWLHQREIVPRMLSLESVLPSDASMSRLHSA